MQQKGVFNMDNADTLKRAIHRLVDGIDETNIKLLRCVYYFVQAAWMR